MKRLIALALLALFASASLTACNTIAGAGKDVKDAGKAIEKTADKCKDGKC
ncbi:entericidin A/B family lipoprotein [Thermomonas flagellata]|uniref:entericidin A/B family lipoprotein n=1 Tax=Thermomonas flagellata TaxID=2888524 RepID=UPI001F050233|nr:entericidin A/B family lipoprotein [Thermomonas flagellata]